MSAASESDEALLRRFVAGEAEAFGTLLQRYNTPVYSFVLRSVRDKDRAKDITQDVFTKVVQNASSFAGDAKFSTWLYSIARNACIDHSRKMRFRRHQSLDAPAMDGGTPRIEQVASAAPGTERDVMGQRFREALQAAVEMLPDDQREVFLLRQIQGMPFKDIAEVLSIPENTVKSRMRYALTKLQEQLSEYQEHARAVGGAR